MEKTHLLVFKHIGPRVLLLERNHRYIAMSQNLHEVEAVSESFAPSVHWGFLIVAQDESRVLVDATNFFLRDAHGVGTRMDETGQGEFELDHSRSAIYLPRTKSFPQNTETKTPLTFTSPKPGSLVGEVFATADTATFRMHHSLVQLPDADYSPRQVDPRIGVQGPTVHDYAAPLTESLRLHLASRFRLKKVDPRASHSSAVKPIFSM